MEGDPTLDSSINMPIVEFLVEDEEKLILCRLKTDQPGDLLSLGPRRRLEMLLCQLRPGLLVQFCNLITVALVSFFRFEFKNKNYTFVYMENMEILGGKSREVRVSRIL